MTRRNTGRSRGSGGRPPWCESWAGRDGANQEYLNDEIFSQPLFSPGQLSRASAAPSVGSTKANVKCSLLSVLSPHVARCRHRGADNNNHQPHTFTLLSARNRVILAVLIILIFDWKMFLRNPMLCNIWTFGFCSGEDANANAKISKFYIVK